ncbi:heterokaryon incompatibility protein-domain-containing protein [Annulohypoxylon moriforme]|nr:heterokaryon incompatibility protein-domain-containing protein [Annulohypoxylon moriforme]
MKSRRATKGSVCVGCRVFRSVEYVFLRFYWDPRTRRRLILITHDFQHFSPLQNFRKWAICHICRVVWRTMKDIAADPDTALVQGISVNKVVSAQWRAHHIRRPLETLRDKDLPNAEFEEFFMPIFDDQLPLRLEDLLPRGIASQRNHEYFNTDSLKAWLKFCDRNHGPACSQTTLSCDLPLGFRLIDTEAMCITDSPKTHQYVALSYVWSLASSEPSSAAAGLELRTDNWNDLSKAGSLSLLDLPDVIADAIRLCVTLGQQYLWVDRLCILQNDPISRGAQIQAMGQIYELASFTIVAAGAGDGTFGLRGTAGRPRPKASRSTLHIESSTMSREELRFNDAIGPMRLVEESPWSQRGWTFQEQILSRRLIFMTSTRVLVQCAKALAVETAHAFELFREDGPGGGSETALSVRDITELRFFYGLIERYSQRQLSFQSDILLALTGVSKAASRLLNTQITLGLPERNWLRSLMWEVRHPEQPKYNLGLGFPSWTWAAWDNAVLWRGNPAQAEFLGLLTVFHYTDASLGLRSLSKGEGWIMDAWTDQAEGQDQTSLSIIDEIDHIIFARMGDDNPPAYSLAQARKALRRGHYASDIKAMWLLHQQNPWTPLSFFSLGPGDTQIALAHPGALAFRTTVAKVLILPRTGEIEYEYHRLCSVDRPSRIVGISRLTEAPEGIDYSKLYDAAVLGGILTVDEPLDNPDSWKWTLVVMVMQTENGISRRVTIGEIGLNTWNFLRPKWKSIILL